MSGLTVAQYAEAKRLDVHQLASWGVDDDRYGGQPAVRYTYWSSATKPEKEEGRWRVSLNGGNNFRWAKGVSAKRLYGWNRVDRDKPTVLIVEGESDCHTLWQIGFRNVLGVPGVQNVPDSISQQLNWAETVYVIDEQDDGSPFLISTLAQRLGDKLRIVTVHPDAKDFSDLWVKLGGDTIRFKETVLGIVEAWRAPTDEEQRSSKKTPPARYRHDEPSVPVPEGGTLSELLAEVIEPVRFVIDGLIPEGLCLLAGKPKLGKSWLALEFSLAICAGVPTLQHATSEAEVLYIALEDGKRRMQDRVRILGGHRLPAEALTRFHYRMTWPDLTNGGLALLEEWMSEYPETRLIVIDTYGKVRGSLAGKDRYTEEYELLGKLQSFAIRHRLALLGVHHLRKQGADDWLEQLSGTQAITGAADTLLGLFRERGQMDATLRLVSREVDEKDLALKFDGGRWESMGDAAAYRTSVEQTEVVEAIEGFGGEARTSEIAGLVSKSLPNTSKLLGKLVKEGIVRKVSHGVYALNDHYNTVNKTTSHISTLTALTEREDQEELPDAY